jgi:gamma-glutamylcyclotransferase
MSTAPLDIPFGNRSRTPSPNRDGRTLYFAYGSNLWRHQMQHRCPGAQYIGVARLRHFKWQTNSRGYANVIEAPPAPYSPSTAKWLGPLMGGEQPREDNDRVYGLVYRLEKEDERKLDGYEDVPESYEKEQMWVEFWGKREGADGVGQPIDVKAMKSQRIKVLVYVDKKCTENATPGGTYRYKINVGIRDALAEGIPQSYVDQCIRPFVPVDNEHRVVTMAIEDAVRMGIDVKSIVNKTEDELAEKGAKEEGLTQVSQGTLTKHLEKILADANGGENDLGGFHRGRAMSSTW